MNGKRKRCESPSQPASQRELKYHVLQPPSEKPYDKENGEIVAILPYSLGSHTQIVQAIMVKDEFQKLQREMEMQVHTEMDQSNVPQEEPVVQNKAIEQNKLKMMENSQTDGVELVDLESEEESNDSFWSESKEVSGKELTPLTMVKETITKTFSDDPPHPILTEEEANCPKCTHPSMRLLRNILFGVGDSPEGCVGIPVCMNIRCMYISPNLQKLEMPKKMVPPPDPDKSFSEFSDIASMRYPMMDEFIRSAVELGKRWKKEPTRRYPPIDKLAVSYFREVSNAKFLEALEDAFPDGIPEVPLEDCV